MSRMLAIRYVTLAALVVWLGGMVTLALVTAPTDQDLRQFQLVAYGCGAIIFVLLIVHKFIGPPPLDFFPRVGLVAVMLLVAAVASARPRMSLLVNSALGFVLLTWYGAQTPDMKIIGNFTVADTSKLSVLYYFAYFLVVLPLLGRFEKPRPLPTSISESVLKHSPATT